MIRNGSFPVTTSRGSGVSGESCDKSSWQAKKRRKGPPFLGDVVADRPAQHRIPSLECVQHRPLRDFALNLQAYLGPHPRKRSQVLRKHDLDHGSCHRLVSRYYRNV